LYHPAHLLVKSPAAPPGPLLSPASPPPPY